MKTDAPDAIRRFLEAEHEGDPEALASCFRPDGIVLDEGRTHIGHDEIIGWRREAAAAYEYTATVTAEERLGPDAHRVVKHLEGDFPGGVANLEYLFALRDLQIAALMIVQQKDA